MQEKCPVKKKTYSNIKQNNFQIQKSSNSKLCFVKKFLFCTINLYLPLYTPFLTTLVLVTLIHIFSCKCIAKLFAVSHSELRVLSVCSFAHLLCVHMVFKQYFDIPFFHYLSFSFFYAECLLLWRERCSLHLANCTSLNLNKCFAFLKTVKTSYQGTSDGTNN